MKTKHSILNSTLTLCLINIFLMNLIVDQSPYISTASFLLVILGCVGQTFLFKQRLFQLASLERFSTIHKAYLFDSYYQPNSKSESFYKLSGKDRLFSKVLLVLVVLFILLYSIATTPLLPFAILAISLCIAIYPQWFWYPILISQFYLLMVILVYPLPAFGKSIILLFIMLQILFFIAYQRAYLEMLSLKFDFKISEIISKVLKENLFLLLVLFSLLSLVLHKTNFKLVKLKHEPEIVKEIKPRIINNIKGQNFKLKEADLVTLKGNIDKLNTLTIIKDLNQDTIKALYMELMSGKYRKIITQEELNQKLIDVDESLFISDYSKSNKKIRDPQQFDQMIREINSFESKTTLLALENIYKNQYKANSLDSINALANLFLFIVLLTCGVVVINKISQGQDKSAIQNNSKVYMSSKKNHNLPDIEVLLKDMPSDEKQIRANIKYLFEHLRVNLKLFGMQDQNYYTPDELLKLTESYFNREVLELRSVNQYLYKTFYSAAPLDRKEFKSYKQLIKRLLKLRP